MEEEIKIVSISAIQRPNHTNVHLYGLGEDNHVYLYDFVSCRWFPAENASE